MLSWVCHDFRDAVVFERWMGEITMETESSETLSSFACNGNDSVRGMMQNFFDHLSSLKTLWWVFLQTAKVSDAWIKGLSCLLHYQKPPEDRLLEIPIQTGNKHPCFPNTGTKHLIRGSGSLSSAVSFTWPLRPRTHWCPCFHESSLG